MEDIPEVTRFPFLRALDEAVVATQQNASLLGLLLIDITNLARINHYHGYQTGDLILATAHRQLLGINLSIDDFGIGYSSLSYFKHIPAAELKIDRSFVSSLMVDAQDLELVKIMIHIAHQFGLAVVAEGVEDRPSMDRLRELGCDYAQGYYFSRGLPAVQIESWLRDWPGLH